MCCRRWGENSGLTGGMPGIYLPFVWHDVCRHSFLCPTCFPGLEPLRWGVALRGARTVERTECGEGKRRRLDDLQRQKLPRDGVAFASPVWSMGPGLYSEDADRTEAEYGGSWTELWAETFIRLGYSQLDWASRSFPRCNRKLTSAECIISACQVSWSRACVLCLLFVWQLHGALDAGTDWL